MEKSGFLERKISENLQEGKLVEIKCCDYLHFRLI